ncbi:PIN domain-containing protein [Spartinivicinus ruber]|uniref:PIN domain-containing protein n=1 Tax=Spartinivicinus ruber TaxID=2683272 RepID=UPI0013D7389D|nr:type II toxin-antitoxin system VapC family toxin [Spartinivicinus ruber]
MIAIDTNVLLRYLLQDDESQSKKANQLINGQAQVLITDVVLTETLWTLKGKKYKASKEDILNVLDSLFKERNIVFEDGPTIWRAMNDYRLSEKVKVGSKKKDADFADVLIINKSRQVITQKNSQFGGLYTFDLAAQQISGAKAP